MKVLNGNAVSSVNFEEMCGQTNRQTNTQTNKQTRQLEGYSRHSRQPSLNNSYIQISHC